jgi:hypothetical protein
MSRFDEMSEGIQKGFDAIDDFLFDVWEGTKDFFLEFAFPMVCIGAIVLGIVLFFGGVRLS